MSFDLFSGDLSCPRLTINFWLGLPLADLWGLVIINETFFLDIELRVDIFAFFQV